MRKMLLACLLAVGLLARPTFAQEQEALPPELQQTLDTLAPVTGSVRIPEAEATLDLGEDYLYYGPADARTILVDIWGNPPGEAAGVLGLVMPAGTTPLADAWGAVVTFEETGWISSDDARDADYDVILAKLQESSREENAQRRLAGYPGVEVVGWAKAPRYDAVDHSVLWARELAFDGEDVNSLNYDLRTLGRRGVLSINIVSVMPELPEIELAAADLASHASFNPGARYEEYDSSADNAAGYGIAGLVAGGAGLAVAKKVGLLALLLKFAKPILFGLVLLFGLLLVPMRRRFFGRREGEETEPREAGRFGGETAHYN